VDKNRSFRFDFIRSDENDTADRKQTRKKGHYKKSQSGYISSICGEFPTQPNLTKIGI